MENEWVKLKKILAWQLPKVRNKKEVIEEARNKGNDGLMSFKECTRMRMGESWPTNHEDHIAVKGNNSLQH